jgi:SAM-dependent methyltransferase
MDSNTAQHQLECPLCAKEAPVWTEESLTSQDGRRFYHCHACNLLFCSPEVHLTIDEEKMRYDTHDNNPVDEHYLAFLGRVLEPIQTMLKEGMRAVDYGSGPGPAMPILLKRYGIECTLYDPIYAPEGLDGIHCSVSGARAENPDGSFDLVTSTETFEHFHQPAESIQHITALLRPGGLLCIMTEQWTELDRFSTWYYTRDDTHTCFYHSRTFEWIARHFGFEILHNDNKRVVCMRKLAD